MIFKKDFRGGEMISDTEREKARRVLEHLDKVNAKRDIPDGTKTGNSEKIEVMIGKSETVELPDSAAAALEKVLGRIAEGKRVRVVDIDTPMSTQEAADYLNVSRPFLVKLLEEGKILFTKVGNRRRVDVESLIAFKERNREARLKALKALAQQAQETDMGY
jgi:excisionase family DNA binding protein